MNKIKTEIRHYQAEAVERVLQTLDEDLVEAEKILAEDGPLVAYAVLRGNVAATLALLGIYLTDEGADAFRPSKVAG